MKKISVSLSGHQTSITLEPEFIDVLHTLAARNGKSIATIINEIDDTRAPNTNLSSAVRVWILHELIQRINQ
ncbi:MAG: ribbon-helix-helix domain-containing protein [Alphaproteobacteria bacterium]|nr:ribbon-helix-helix domain-containing protein [Alphaproteobacteria bacterium]